MYFFLFKEQYHALFYHETIKKEKGELKQKKGKKINKQITTNKKSPRVSIKVQNKDTKYTYILVYIYKNQIYI